MAGLFDDDLYASACALIDDGKARGLQIAAAESCTGGLLAGLLTEIPGSSAVFDRGFVTYSNAAKADMLGVPQETIAARGAVSEAVACAMAEGALARSRADIAVAITGIAGPGGGSADKPVGLVWFGLAHTGRETRTLARRFGDIGRSKVRREAVRAAISMLHENVGCRH